MRAPGAVGSAPSRALNPCTVSPRVANVTRVVTPRLQRGSVQCASLHDAAANSTSISDVAVPAVEQLIQRASQHIDGTAAIGLLHSLLHGLGDANHVADVASNSASSGLGEAFQTALDAANAAGHAAGHAAAVGTSLPELVMAATSSTTPEATSLQGLALLAADRLGVVQEIDPDAYELMRSSLAGLMEGVRSTLESASPGSAEPAPLPWTNALVLGVQQLVTTLRAPGTGGVSIEAMMAAQHAMQATLTAAAQEAAGLASAARAVGTGAAASELPAGVSGLLQICLAMVAMIVAAVPRGDWKQRAASANGAKGDTVPLRYDVDELQAYFSRRPAVVVARNAEVVSKLSTFTLAILADWKTGQWEANMPSRAKWIRQISESLGPAYIKIAQALSTRVDVIPQTYLDELAKLQDNVKIFPTVEARRVLEEGLGQPVDAVFEWLSEEPIAAASLGQVYRGKLRAEWGGKEVAVKVQRPGALEASALDIFVMRRAAVLFSMLPGMSDKWAGALDDWADRFFQEMDYQLEAYNTMTFKKHMEGLQGIMVATVYPELTSRKVIVTQWIEGERLADSKSEDVRALCGTLLNCYLIQLLETGLLHADPHPGNLMRTPDGKIVILDFGLMTEVTEDQRIALVEYIAHLTVEDWEGVAGDLVKLGFMPEGTLPPGAEKIIAPIMEQVMGQLVRGGGLKNGINIMGLTGQLQGVATNYKLAIPPYFALVLRAFSVIEGIALKVDPKYAIVHECLPYMSRRLLTDNNPRMRAALHQLLYGKGTRLDVERLSKMVSAFGAFSTAAAEAPLATGPTFSAAAAGTEIVKGHGRKPRDGTLLTGMLTGGQDEPILSEPMKEVLKVVFSKDGSYAQEILVDEAVAAIDAMSREAMGETLRLVASSATTVAALRSVEALGPLRAMLLPLPLPMEMLGTMQPAVALSTEDRQALNTIRTLLDLLVPPPGAPGPNVANMGVRAVRTMGEVAPLLPELLPGVQVTLEMFFRQLVRRMALRLAEDLDTASKAASSQRQAAAQGYLSPGMTQGNVGATGAPPPPPPQAQAQLPQAPKASQGVWASNSSYQAQYKQYGTQQRSSPSPRNA